MDIFDQYLFDEIVSEYESPCLTEEDYEGLYTRFFHLNHLEEVQPYLLVMQFFGLGTNKNPDAALEELKRIMVGNYELIGLYQALSLVDDPNNIETKRELQQAKNNGYSGKHLRTQPQYTLESLYRVMKKVLDKKVARNLRR